MCSWFPQWLRHRANNKHSRIQTCDSVWTCCCCSSCLNVGWSPISNQQDCCITRTVVQNVCLHLCALCHTWSVHSVWSCHMTYTYLNLGLDGYNFKPLKQDCGLEKRYSKMSSHLSAYVSSFSKCVAPIPASCVYGRSQTQIRSNSEHKITTLLLGRTQGDKRKLLSSEGKQWSKLQVQILHSGSIHCRVPENQNTENSSRRMWQP